MGTSSKIYKPKESQDSFNLFQRFIDLSNKYKNTSVYANCYKSDIKEVNSLISKYNNNCTELTGTINAKFDSKFQKLFRNIIIIEFGILKVKAHSNGKTFGAEVITHRNNELIDLNIHLPYLSKSQTKESLVNFIYRANEPLCLHFRNREQIENTIEKLIYNTFDDRFMDSSWTLKHSNFTYRVGGFKKSKFEGENIETFRPTSIRLKPSEGFGKLIGWNNYKTSTVEFLANYFQDEAFSLYFNTKNLESLKEISKIKTNFIELITKINLDQSFKNYNRDDIEYLMIENNSSIEVEHEKLEIEDDPSFNAYIFKDRNGEFETRLYIDKLAAEDWIDKLIKEVGEEFKYSHDE